MGLAKFGGELIPQVRCSILKRAISDFFSKRTWLVDGKTE